jgi:large subunit ribosomal protein L19
MLDIMEKVDQLSLRKKIPQVKTGDRVRVHQKIREGAKERIQIFEGVVIKTAGGKGINGSFTVRRIASGVGVEKSFPLHLPTLIKVEKLKSAKVRQARIFYVRKLVGKAARRMKGEKDDAAVWENVIEDKKAEPIEIPQAELDAIKAAEKAEEKSEAEEKNEGTESETKPEAEKPTEDKTSKNS